jgi:hypothetical protein
MTRDRLLIILPEGTDRDKAIRAIPQWIWDQGYTIEAWTQLAYTMIFVPCFKLWVDFIGVPMECIHKDEIAGATGHFGTYLGTLESEGLGELSVWSAILATTDLALVPKTVSFMVGGLETVAEIRVRRWVCVSVYTALDLPQPLPPRSISYHKYNSIHLIHHPRLVITRRWLLGDLDGLRKRKLSP